MAYWLSASVYSIGQDKINNYTNVRVDLYFCRDSGGAWNAYTTYGYIMVDGQRQDFSVGSYDTSGRIHIATRDFRVYHNSDGSKSVNFYCYYNADNAPYVDGLETSGTTGLPTIPRAATISAVNWGNIESAFNVTFSSPSSSFNYKLRVSIPSVKAIVTYSSYGSGTNKTFTQAEKNSIYQYMVDNGLSSVSLGFVIETYNGTTKIGESSEPTRTVTRAGLSSITTNANSYTTPASINITIGRKNSLYTHKLYHKLNDVNLSTTTPTTSETYTGITSAVFGAKYPNATSGTLQLVLETYYNSVYLGQTTKTVTINLQSYTLAKPTLTVSAQNDNAVVKAWGIYLKMYTKLNLSLSGASGMYSSTLHRYILGGKDVSTPTWTTDILTTSGTQEITGSYLDSRMKESPIATTQITVHDYYNPVITTVTAKRYNGTAVHEEGTQVQITASFSCASCNGKNTVTAVAYIRAETVSTWTTLGSIATNTAKSFSNVALAINTVYLVKVIATDALGNSTESGTVTITTAGAIIDVLKGGTGAAIGKMASTANLFEIAWNTKVNGDLEVTKNIKVNSLTANAITSTSTITATNGFKVGAIDIRLIIYPINSVYMTYTNINPGTFLGGTWSLVGQDQYIRGAGSSFGGGATGGSGTSGATTITEAQMPSHGHGRPTQDGQYTATGWQGSQDLGTIRASSVSYTTWFSSDTTGGGTSHSHSVTPPYIAIYFWRRTA